MKIGLNHIPIKGSINTPIAEHNPDGSWSVKTDGPGDLAKPQGSYLVFCADGSVIRRTLDPDGFIIHEIKVK